MIDSKCLKRQIDKAGYTQNTLAKRIGVSKNTMSSKINGKSEFTIDNIERICKTLNISSKDELIKIFFPNWL